ncbi:MAG: lipid A export permease/ATP-binding protein MsbA [Gammaproteobacteria bacterium]|nr:lipid A export permease/ATP-binding protein MsbA [Gammaproteobacteria bacterium]
MSKKPIDLNDGKAVYRRLLGYVKPYWKAFIIVIIGMAMVAATEVGFAALIKPMLDGTFVEKDPFWITVIPLALIGIFLVRGIGSFATSYLMSWVGRHVVKDMRSEIFDHLLLLPTRFYDKNASGQIISKIIYDAEQVSDASSRALTIIIQDSLVLIGLIGWMFYLSWEMTLVFLIIGPVMAVMVASINRRVRRDSRRLQDSMGNVTEISQEAIEAQRVVKIFGGKDYERQGFDKANEYNRKQFMKIVSTQSAYVPFVQLVAALLLALIIYLSTRPGEEVMTVGTFMSFISAMLMLFPPLKRLTTVNVVLQRGVAAAQSIFGLLEEKAEIDRGTQTLAQVRGDVRFENVRFSYDSDKGEVLKGVNFSVPSGKSVAFVGRSGSGKSTLVSLLPRFYHLENGVISIDGININDLRMDELRKHIALVSQDITLFNDTIAHNIAYGRLETATEEQIIEAAKAAYAWDFIKDLPDGLNTQVGEHGVLLSGGQRQRLAIARAILKDAPILILDEATSALDSESERHIQAALEQLMKNRTTFVIAHRLSTIENVDQIVVMDNGVAVEQGTHQELMARNGHYANLHRIQFGHG